MLIVLARRAAWLLLLAVVGGALFAWIRERRAPAISAPPEWPPLEPTAMPEPIPAPAAVDSTPEPVSGPAWVDPDDGSCPDGYPIKVNLKSGVFHVPGGRFYDRTNPQRCYAAAEQAIADGYRQSKS